MNRVNRNRKRQHDRRQGRRTKRGYDRRNHERNVAAAKSAAWMQKYAMGTIPGAW